MANILFPIQSTTSFPYMTIIHKEYVFDFFLFSMVDSFALFYFAPPPSPPPPPPPPKKNNTYNCSSLIWLIILGLPPLDFKYRKNSKNWDTWNNYHNCPTIGTVGFYSAVLCSKDADRITNREDPDQTAPWGAVWSGSALFAQTYLSQYLKLLRYFLLSLFFSATSSWLWQHTCSSKWQNWLMVYTSRYWETVIWNLLTSIQSSLE